MKKYAIYSLLVIAVAATFTLMAFKPNEKSAAADSYILVEIYEIPSYKDKGVHIHYGGVKREFVAFKEFTAENHDDNGDIILNAINKLTADGYVIQSTCAGMTDAGMITKIFMKKNL